MDKIADFEVVIVRLRNSPEEFLCRLVSQGTDGSITIETPFMIGMISQNQLGFQPWSPLCKDRVFTFERGDVLFVREPFDALVKDFLEHTSKIKIVSTIPKVMH